MSKPEPCKWMGLREALAAFAEVKDGTQGQGHIRALHWYVACRLVIEGGFDPSEITPRPPFRVRKSREAAVLEHDATCGEGGETTLLGGLKTKTVDIVVAKPGIGPCLAVSMKGTVNAFRNLTNRMEEAAGDCTNLHIAYPALVYSFWNVLRANRSGVAHPKPTFGVDQTTGHYLRADVAVDTDGAPTSSIRRYHQALLGLTGRWGMRDDLTRYEACGMTLVDVSEASFGEVFQGFPEPDSSLRMEQMFKTMYEVYDLRFVYQAPDLERKTRRRVWAENSPVLNDPRILGFAPRTGPSVPG